MNGLELIKLFNVFGRINTIFEWISKLAGTNLLWVLFNFPIVYLLLSLYTTKEMSHIFMLMIMIALLVPFVFFPATTAMFGIVRKWVMKEEVPIIRFFWKYYKENYRRSLAGGFIFSVLWAIAGVDYYYLHGYNSLVGYAFIFLMVWLFTLTLYFFAHTVHTETKLGQGLKNVFLLSIANPFFSFGVAIISIVILYISFTKITFLLPIFTGSAISFLAFLAYNKVLTSIVLLQQKASE